MIRAERLILYSIFFIVEYGCFQGFYTVFRKVFEDIVAEDTEYVDDPDEFDVPSFGSSEDSYEEVNYE